MEGHPTHSPTTPSEAASDSKALKPAGPEFRPQEALDPRNCPGPLETVYLGYVFHKARRAHSGTGPLVGASVVAVLRQDQAGRPVAIEGEGRRHRPPS